MGTTYTLMEQADTLGGRLVQMALSLQHAAFRVVPRDGAAGAVALVDDGTVITGVLAIALHLERAHPEHPLLSAEPGERARSLRLLELALPALSLARADSSERARTSLSTTLATLDAHLRDDERASAFAVGRRTCLGALAVAVVARAAADAGLSLDGAAGAHRVLTGVGGLSEVRRAYLPRRAGYVADLAPERRDAALELVQRSVGPVAAKLRFLEAIGWAREVEEEFFRHDAGRLPEPTYAIDRDAATSAIADLSRVEAELAGDHVLYEWLRATVRSFIDSQRMLLAVGTKDFYQRSLELYGGADTTAFDRDSTNLDLAQHVERRLGDQAQFVETEALDTDEFVVLLERKLAARRPHLPLEIVRDPRLSAKVICGRTRLRVREGARFGRAEAEGLWLHEVETHALTAQNGAAQRSFPLLKSGGPRTTRTQEGLAVFAELQGGALSSPRMLRIAQRVRLVAMAEDGASFLDLYRALVDRGLAARDAYLDATRICRGGVVSGGAPFTKDASYLAGLLDIYTLLRFMLQRKSPLIGELLVSGRVHGEDLLALLWLRREGVLTRPQLLPDWASDWDRLLSYFAFSSFLTEIQVNLDAHLPPDVEGFIAECAEAYDREERA